MGVIVPEGFSLFQSASSLFWNFVDEGADNERKSEIQAQTSSTQ
jgi:hypothetical protein